MPREDLQTSPLSGVSLMQVQSACARTTKVAGSFTPHHKNARQMGCPSGAGLSDDRKEHAAADQILSFQRLAHARASKPGWALGSAQPPLRPGPAYQIRFYYSLVLCYTRESCENKTYTLFMSFLPSPTQLIWLPHGPYGRCDRLFELSIQSQPRHARCPRSIQAR